MILRILGSGSADGIPAFFSDDRVSEHARRFGGKDIRTRSGALVDGHIKIDLPPDTLHQLQRDGLRASDWTALVFTHSHDDHFSYAELQYAVHPFNDNLFAPFAIYGNAFVLSEISAYYPDWPFELHETRSFVPFRHAGYTITPVRAEHLEDEDAQNLLIDDGQRTLLYATDTGWWPEVTWNFLRDRHLDLLVLECTEAFAPTPYHGHLDARSFLKALERLRSQGTVDERTVVCTTHHSHSGEATHEELERFFGPHGVRVGFDGLELEI